MKKLTFLSVLLCLCACTGNKTTNTNAPLTDEETIVLQETVVNQLDSLANLLCDSTQLASFYTLLEPTSFVLTDDQKLAKPDYLLENKDFESIVTLSEKYRAQAMAMVDSRVSKLYGLDKTSDYEALIEYFQAEIADNAFNDMAAKGHQDFFEPQTYIKLYEDMKAAQRLPYFYESTTAMVVETLYILSKTDDILVSQLSDDQTQALVRHLSIVAEASDLLSQSNPYLKKSAQSLIKLANITASNSAELKEQLAKTKNDIAALRILLLKD